MRDETRPSEPDRRYASAHELHYGSKNLRGALDHYLEIMVIDAGTPEAGYARSQIDNIVKAVVPEQTLFDAQVELAGRHLQREELDSTLQPQASS